MTITFSMCDGSGHSIEITSSTKTTGRAHVVGTFDNGTKTASLYINGALKSSSTNASFAWTSSPGGALAIGSNNKNDAADTPSVGGKAMPEFKMHLGRLWRGALTASDVSELYRHWHPSGHTGIPYSVTGTALSAWYMNSEVGDKSGSVGSGWLADAIGTNHLHILNTGAGSGDTSYIFAPSGSVRGTSPTSGATGVSGAVALEADGVTGDGLVMQYYFEVDEANTFDTAALRSSGWLVTKNYWRPRLKPSTTYYWRVKVKDANGTESSWSSTYYLTTRAATEWFVRPRTYVAGTYGSEDGTSYENAWNGFRFNGYKGEQQLTLYEAQAKLNIYAAPGDTVWACGDFGLLSTSSFSSITSTSPYSEYVHAVGMDDDYPVYLRLDHPSHPGRMFKGFSFTGSHNWRNDGGNVYSTATYYAGLSSSSRLTVMQDGVPNCDFDNPLSNSTIGYDSGMTLASPGFYVDSGRMYVRMPDNDVPDNNLWYFLGSTETFLLYLNQCQYLHIMGGDWGCCSPLSGTGGEESTHIKIYGGRYKFNLSSWGPFQISDFVDYWTIENNEISYVPNGVYGTDTGSGDVSRTGDYIVVRNNWFHDIGTAAGWTDSDGHCVGVQTGTGWTIEDNLGERCGTAIEIWGGDFKHSRDHLIQRNVVRDIEARSVTFGAGIAITGGTSKLGIRDGIRILNNVIYNADGSGIHISIADPVEVVGNLIMNVGYGPNSYTDHGILLLCSASVSSRGWWNNNVVIGPTSEFLRIVGNGVTSEYMKIDHNKYWKESPTTASSSNQFRAYISPYDYSFNGWQAGTPWDQNSTWGDPASTALPPDFDDVLVDMFVGTVGDVDGDGGVDADDRALLLANGSQYLAVQRVMENLLAE